MRVVKGPKRLPIKKAISALKHEDNGFLRAMLMNRCMYILKRRGLAIPYKYIISGADLLEVQVILNEIAGLFYGTAEDDCHVFGVILPEDGVEGVLNDVMRVVAVGRHYNAHGELVFWSGEIYPLVGVSVRLRVFCSVVEAEAVPMVHDCLKNWVLLAKQALKGYLVPMLLLKLSNRV